MEDKPSKPNKLLSSANFILLAISRLKVSHKIALCFCCLSLIILSSFWLLSKSTLQDILQQHSDRLGQTLVNQTADSLQELVLANDILSLNVILSQLVSDGNILAIAAYDIDGELIAAAGEAMSSTFPLQPDSLISTIYSTQITLQDSIAGTLQLELDTSTLQQNIEQTQLVFWIILGTGLLLTIISAFALASHFIAPVIEVTDAIQNPLNDLELADTADSNELSLLKSSCSELLEKYQQNYYELEQLNNMNPDNQLVDTNGRAIKSMASILVVKVVNINTAIELLHPSTLAGLLAEFNFYLEKCRKLYGATLQRVTGASAILIFDSRQGAVDQHSINAVCCAQLFLKLMQKVKKAHKAKSSQALAFKLAVHSGDIFIADCTALAHQEHDFLLGKAIDTSCFLCRQSEPNELIISESTYFQASNQIKLVSKASRDITMPSDNISFNAYILHSDMPDSNDLLQQQCNEIIPE